MRLWQAAGATLPPTSGRPIRHVLDCERAAIPCRSAIDSCLRYLFAGYATFRSDALTDCSLMASRQARSSRTLPPTTVAFRWFQCTDAERCLRFSSKVFRCYTDCCRTPIGNTAGPRFPIVGLIHSFMSHDADGHSRDEVLGAPPRRIYDRSAVGPLPPHVPAPPSLSLFVLRASRLLGWWLRGPGRPTPFFDGHTNAPLSAPRVLTPSERAAPAKDPVDRNPEIATFRAMV